MKKLEQILENYLLAQVSLEERLYKGVERQLSQSNIDEYPEVKKMLSGVKEVLKRHYARLNIALDHVPPGEPDMVITEQRDLVADELGNLSGTNNRIRREQVSQMLHDDYAVLNLAAMGNTLIHTTALAANSQEIADIALEHLANLTHFVVQMSELVPKVVAQELSVQFPEVTPAIGEIAAKNIQGAWLSPEIELSPENERNPEDVRSPEDGVKKTNHAEAALLSVLLQEK